MQDKKPVFVYGASGHAKVVIDIIERQGAFGIVCLVDDNPDILGTEVYGYQVLGGREELLAVLQVTAGCKSGIVAIGNNKVRQKIAHWMTSSGFDLVTVVHPSAQLARGVTLGEGTALMPGVIINSDTVIGNNVIINTSASVDHDCVIGNGVHIAPGAHVCGGVRIREGAFICSGATIIPNLTIGAHSVIGAGSTVLRDVPDGVTVVGSPASEVRAYG